LGKTAADEYWSRQPPLNGKKEAPRRWSELVGKTVSVEGIAWGSFEKGWGEYVILHSAQVYVPAANFNERRLQGKLVRVEGILRMAKVGRAKYGSAGPNQEVTYFVIDRPKITAIAEATWPYLQILRE
jgi:hypothetical protein